jgi:hypothetical protein
MIFLVIGGIVLGVLGIIALVWYIRSKRRASLAGITMECPKGDHLLTNADWVRQKILGGDEIYQCPVCHTDSTWNVKTTPPTFIG